MKFQDTSIFIPITSAMRAKTQSATAIDRKPSSRLPHLLGCLAVAEYLGWLQVPCDTQDSLHPLLGKDQDYPTVLIQGVCEIAVLATQEVGIKPLFLEANTMLVTVHDFDVEIWGFCSDAGQILTLDQWLETKI